MYKNESKKNTAVLLAHCTDRPGIIAAITDFLLKNKGNIIDLDQYVDPSSNHFFIRVEWELDNFIIPQEKIEDFYDTLIAQQFEMKWEIRFCRCIPRVALFVSKYAHCYTDILARWEAKEWDIEIPVIISNHEDLGYIAERYKIPYHHIPIKKANKKEQELKTLEILKSHDVDMIILARYMQIITQDFISHYKNKIINIHHSSLPAFAGANPYKSAYQRGVKFMGATAHYVTADLDAGPIIAQDVVNITHNDNISDMKRKGRDIEKVVLAKAVWSHINNNVLAYQNKTVVFN